MIRNIIKIDEDKCVGCGLCVNACHEGAIGLIDGKAKLLRDDYCDGLGNCLPVCPTNAINFEIREAEGYDKMAAPKRGSSPAACPGTRAMKLEHRANNAAVEQNAIESQLNQWPVQIKLMPVNSPYFKNANLLVAADCSAFSYGNFHNDFMRNKITVIGCPKLDEGDYSEKLTAILKNNSIKSVTVVRMEVPCCAGIENAVKTALQNCGKLIQWKVITITTDGRIVED